MDWIPRSVRKVINHMMNAYHELEQHVGAVSRCDEEMAEQLGVQMDEFYRLLGAILPPGVPLISLDVANGSRRQAP